MGDSKTAKETSPHSLGALTEGVVFLEPRNWRCLAEAKIWPAR